MLKCSIEQFLDFYSNNDFRKLCIVTFRSLYRGDTGWIEIYVAMWQYDDKVADVTESQVNTMPCLQTNNTRNLMKK